MDWRWSSRADTQIAPALGDGLGELDGDGLAVTEWLGLGLCEGLGVCDGLALAEWLGLGLCDGLAEWLGLGLDDRLGLCDGLALADWLGRADRVGLAVWLALADWLGLPDWLALILRLWPDDGAVLVDGPEPENMTAPIAEADPMPQGEFSGCPDAASAGAIVALERMKRPAVAWAATTIARTIPAGNAALRC